MSSRILLALFVLVASGPRVMAQGEPFLGVWEMNPARSSATRGAMPLSQALVIVAEPGGVTSTQVTISATAGSAEVHHLIFDGKPYKTGGSDSDQREMSAKRVSPRRIETNIIRKG